MFSKNTIFKIFSNLFCLFGCIYQLYKINALYFSNETITNVKYEFEEKLSLPAITLCFRKNKCFKEEIRKNFDNISNRFELSDSLNHKLIIKEQFDSLANHSHIFKCQINRKDCQSLTNYSITLSDFVVCYTLFSEINNEHGHIDSIDNAKNDINITIKNKSYVDVISIILHSNKLLNYHYNIRMSDLITLNTSELSTIIYRKTIFKQMNKRSNDRCFEYQSKDECISKCNLDFILNYSKEFPARYFGFDRRSELKFETSLPSKFNGSKECENFCRNKTECYREYYNYNIERDNWRDFSNSDIYRISIRRRNEPDTIYESYQKMYFEEYLCLCSSIISLWFGFSIIMLTNIISNFSQKIINKFKFNSNIIINLRPKLVKNNNNIRIIRVFHK